MYKVKSLKDETEFATLDDAMHYAKQLGILVEIKTPEYVIVGKFGADEIKNGLTPDGHEYGWVKRR
jgi:hypothetical protein